MGHWDIPWDAAVGICLEGGMGVAAFAVLGTPWECSRSCFALCCPVQFAENILAVCLKNQEEQRTFLGCWALPSQARRAAVQEEPCGL